MAFRRGLFCSKASRWPGAPYVFTRLLGRVATALSGIAEWDEAGIEAAVREIAEEEALKLGKVAQPLRAALTGSTVSPGIFEVAAVLGRDESLARLADATANRGG